MTIAIEAIVAWRATPDAAAVGIIVAAARIAGAAFVAARAPLVVAAVVSELLALFEAFPSCWNLCAAWRANLQLGACALVLLDTCSQQRL